MTTSSRSLITRGTRTSRPTTKSQRDPVSGDGDDVGDVVADVVADGDRDGDMRAKTKTKTRQDDLFDAAKALSSAAKALSSAATASLYVQPRSAAASGAPKTPHRHPT